MNDAIYLSMPRTAPWGLLCENVTSSTKPEVRNILHCRQKTDRKFRDVWTYGIYTSGHTYIQTDRQTDIAILRTPTGVK